MARDTLTGSRIRERRIALGLRQAALAQAVGISASYLNLIEHNRRRIGGKLLVAIAQRLGVEPALLSEGAGAALIASLREAASDLPQAGAELDRIDEFAGRFPGWAQLLAQSRTRIAALERSVDALTDRLTHDPHLAASLHEMLSTVTAIRSSASILAEPGEVDPEWQARFHRNIYEDSARLADTSRALVAYLEADETTETATGTPQEELDALQDRIGHRVAELEDGAAPVEVAARLGAALTPLAQQMLRAWLDRYAADAAALPAAALRRAVAAQGLDPGRLSQALGCDPAQVMRRLAALPDADVPQAVGLAICDASGALTFRKPLPEFPMPRFGAACPLWPLYQALSRPHVILAQALSAAGRQGGPFRAYAVALPCGLPETGCEPRYQAHMLVTGPADTGALPVAELGVSCRICPRRDCPARREPTILAGTA